MTSETPLKEIPVGSKPARSLYSAEGKLIHPAGFALTASAFARLTGQGIPTVDIFDADPPVDIEGIIRTIVRNAITLDLALETPDTPPELPEVMNRDSITEHIENSPVLRGLEATPEMVQLIRDPLLKALETHRTLLASIPREVYDNAEAEHQLETAIIALALGLVFEYPERDLRVLASSALLHETGRYILSNKQTGNEEFDLLLQREHPAFSTCLLRGCVPDQYDIETAILQHHEQYDGKGYPLGLHGANSAPGVLRKSQEGYVDRFTELLAVANAYSAHRRGLGSYEAAGELEVITFVLQSAETLFNPYVVQELSTLIQRFPVGAPVRIVSTSSGRYAGFTGVVRQTNAESEMVPVKSILLTRNAKSQQITPQEVDLTGERRVRFLLAESV